MSDQPSNEAMQEPQVPAALREVLDAWQPAAARSQYRAELRERFLKLGAAEHNSVELSATETAEVEAQLAQASTTEARPDFKANLRDQFLNAGAKLASQKRPEPTPQVQAAAQPKAQPRLRAVPASPQPKSSQPTAAKHVKRDSTRSSEAGPRRSRRAELERKPRSMMAPMLVSTLAVAAALLLFFYGPWGSNGPTWQGVSPASADQLVIDGQPVSYTDQETLVDSFESGDCRFAIGKQELSVVHLGEGVMLEFPPATEFSIPARPEGEKGLIEIRIITGGLKISTADEFQGRVLVHTPDTTISLSGHLLGVDVYPHGTCLCIVDGEAEMTNAKEGGAPKRVQSNSTTFITREDGKEQLQEGAYHVDDLDDFSTRRDQFLF